MSEENTSQPTGRKAWVKPSVTPHRSGMMNKFGNVGQRLWQDHIDGVPIADLVSRFGSPLFVVSEETLRQSARKLMDTFSSRYPRVRFGWSYKTNYLGAVCNTLHQEGAWAEVVSDFEYEKARSLGVPGKYILFNGPYKHRAILERAVDEQAHIHVDHLDELYLLDQIAEEKGVQVKISIRLNFDTGYTEAWSRFGFNVETGQALDVAWRICESKHLDLTGLHSHIGTFILDPRAYDVQVRTMCNFMHEIEEKMGCQIDVIDIGGGFASHNALHGIYLSPDQVVPSLDQYADTICNALLECTHERLAKGRERPLLIMETGRAVVDHSEYLVTSVVANKRLPDGRRGVVVDAGVNLLFTAFWYNHEVVPCRQIDGMPEDTVLYGPLCMNIDVLRASVMLPPIKQGDALLISPAGAYNNTQWLQFIGYRPNVVMIHSDENVSVIREAENLAVVTAQERVPDHLRMPFADASSH